MVFTLSTVDQRSKQNKPGSLGVLHQLINHLTDSLDLEGAAVGWATGITHPGIEQPQIVVNLGHCPNG